MKSRISIAAIAISLLLHGMSLAFVVSALSSHTDTPAKPLPLAAQLIVIPPPVQPVVPISPPVKKEIPKHPVTIPPKPRPLSVPTHEVAVVPGPTADMLREAKSTIVTNAPPTASAAIAPPAALAPPGKTGVSISATYAGSNRKPAYPMLSRRYGEQGIVMLRVFVQPDGSAGSIEIQSSSGYPLLDEAAKTAVQNWRFSPATVDGKAIAEWYQVPIPFKLQN